MNNIIRRDDKWFCQSCMEYIRDVLTHLREHGIYSHDLVQERPKDKWAGSNKTLVKPRPLGELIPAKDLEAADNPYKPTPEEIEKDRQWGVGNNETKL